MSGTPSPARRLPAAPPRTGRRGWIDRILAIVGIGSIGVLLGLQYAAPNKRVLAVLAAVAVLGIAWRIDMVAGIGLMVLALPYPRGTVFGNSNFALILILLVIWLLRFTYRQAARPTRTPLDMPIVCLVISYIVSFYSITNTHDLAIGLRNFITFIACLLMYYLVVNNVRSTHQLMRLHGFQMVSIATIMLIAVYELNHPGGALVKGWIEFYATAGTEFNTKNIRVGGPFFDYELLSEFTAMCLVLIGFWLARSRTLLQQTGLAMLFLLCFFVLFATVTRGAIISLGVALAYFLWTTRRRLKFVPLTIISVSVVVGFLFTNYYVSNFTRSGDVIGRFSHTYFVGVVPDSRVGAWEAAMARFWQHPFIGRGPYYSTTDGLDVYPWPHNLYLYVACLLGSIGLGIFLWILWKVFRLTRPLVDSVRDKSYAKSYLLIARVLMILFLIDQLKIEYLRSEIYQFQIWLLFASIVAASQIVRHENGGAPAGGIEPRSARRLQ